MNIIRTKKIIAILLTLIMISGTISQLSTNVFAAGTIEITFDNNDGSGKATKISVEANKALAAEQIPIPTREEYIFSGWYKIADGNLQHQAYSVVTDYRKPIAVESLNKDTTLYAHWIPGDHVRLIKTGEDSKDMTLGLSLSSGLEIRKISDNSLVDLKTLNFDSGGMAVSDFPVYKDLNKNGNLDGYEDWRLDYAARSANLSMLLTPEEIAGLMLYSSHQTDWKSSNPLNGQITFLANDDLRHVLIAGSGSTADVHAKWNNNVQSITENFGKGIPANNSSDPRHSAAIGVEFYSNNNGTMSIWPTSLGLAATFDPELMFQYGKIASSEYRAFGISTALSPQIDISTDPRWNRTNGTFGEDPFLASDMTRSYVRGFQGTYENNINAADKYGKWGKDSVNAMIKHWPGGGAGESGKDAHSDFGKYAIFPGENFQAHIIPFVDGALAGDKGSIDVATAVMPYYTISNNVDPTGTDVANAFSEYMISDLLRGKYGFQGVICTDWGVDATRGWGPSIEDMNETERSYELIMAGINQFGGRNTSKYILAARDIAVKNGTETKFDNNMKFSAGKLLLNIFQTGLFENPYLDPKKSIEIASDPVSNAAGIDAQVKAIVTLKNTTGKKGILKSPATKVYVPKNADGKYTFTNLGIDGVKKFTYIDDPNKADLAIVPLGTPTNPPAPDIAFFGGGWSKETGYFPLSLQYSEYTAVKGRELSIAGDYRDKDVAESPSVLNRSYKDKTANATNFESLITLLETKELMGDKPVITVLNVDNPTVMTEIDAVSDIVLARFACSDASVLEILTGARFTTGMLPVAFPENMTSVENQKEDVPRDMKAYIDMEGNKYSFGYGLTWNGSNGYKKINATVNPGFETYVQKEPLTKPIVNIVDNGISNHVNIKTVMLPIGSVGKAYPSTKIATEPSDAEVILVKVQQNQANTAGKLPKGLKFENGTISGTPTRPGAVQIVVKASAPNKKDRVYRLNLLINEEKTIVNPDPNALSIEITLANAKSKNYTNKSYEKFIIALENANDVYTKATPSGGFMATQEEIDKATKDLRETRLGLIRKY